VPLAGLLLWPSKHGRDEPFTASPLCPLIDSPKGPTLVHEPAGSPVGME